jgi:hypothetical protein
MDSLITLVNKWYYLYRDMDNISYLTDMQLSSYILQSIAIINATGTIVGKDNIKIGDESCLIPQGEDGKITLPCWIGSVEAWQKLLGDTTLPIVLGISNGMFYHAGLHAQYSYRPTKEQLRLEADHKRKLEKVDDEIFAEISELFFDLILTPRNDYSYSTEMFLWFYYDFLYSELGEQEDTLSGYMNTLVQYLLPPRRDWVKERLPEEIEVLESGKPYPLIFSNLFKLFLDRFEFEENNSQSQTGEPESTDETLKNISRHTDEVGEINKQLQKGELKKELKKMLLPYEKSDGMKLPEVVVIPAKEIEESFEIPDISFFKVDMNFDFLQKILRARTINRTYGIPRKTGKDIVSTRLFRALTDQKVFSYDQDVEVWKPPEIILLIDGSGSMMVKRGEYLFYHYVLAIAYQMVQVISKITKVTAYVHTSVKLEMSQPALYVLDTDNLRYSFNKALQIRASVNYDGIIIQKVIERHKNDVARKKVLIVLSDGLPAGRPEDRYYAPAAVKHTRKAIEEGKKYNVETIGISLDSETDKDLKMIYENFVGAGNVLQNLENVLLSILERN